MSQPRSGRVIDSADYHDYFIKDGQFIGEFEQMYRNIEDPHHCVALAGRLDNDLLLTIAEHVRGEVRTALDIGCGLGKLTHRFQQKLPGAVVHACDISETAVSKAQAAYPECRFFVHTLGEKPLPFADGSLDLIQMAQVVWCILEVLQPVCDDLFRALRPGGHLAIQNGFYPSSDQKYGGDIVGSTRDLNGFLTRSGFDVRTEIHINPRDEANRPTNSVIWAVKPAP